MKVSKLSALSALTIAVAGCATAPPVAIDHFSPPGLACAGLPQGWIDRSCIRGLHVAVDHSGKDPAVEVDRPVAAKRVAASASPGKPTVNGQCGIYDSGDELMLDLPQDVYIIFKNGTPLRDGSYVLKGRGETLTVPLKGEDAFPGHGENDRYCYYYMVVDVGNVERPPLDPIIVIEP